MIMERSIVPNATLFPNFLTDEVMPLVNGEEWKVIHFGAIACLRFDRTDDGVSLAQIVQGTGLSEYVVRQCLSFLCDSSQILLRQDRPRRPQVYRLNHEIGATQVDQLERRKRGEPLASDPADAPETVEEVVAPEPAAAPHPRSRARVPVTYPERPSVEIRLNGEDQPVSKLLRQALPTEERAAFDHLLRHYPAARREGDESAVWGLYRLWQTYGFACLNNALQGAGADTDLAGVNRDCLLVEIVRLYEQEIGRDSPGLRDELARLVTLYPTLAAWQEAFRIAIKLNKRRLSTVETILQNLRQKAMEEAQRPVTRSRRRTPAAAQVGPTAAPTAASATQQAELPEV
jgi:hypothetical protein